MNRPYKNPNRWMINYVPVIQQDRWIDWAKVIACCGCALIVALMIAFVLKG